MIDNWYKSLKYTEEELNILRGNTYDFENPQVESYDNISILNWFRNKLSYSADKNVYFAECATDIINELFNKHVDDDTLVITSNSEHPSVLKNLRNCKNVLRLSSGDKLDNNIDIISSIRPFKKVFVYLIGLSMGGSYFTPQSMYKYIKQMLVEHNKEHIIVADLVQEMFMLPRDYSIFDYVIGTAHATIHGLNFGMIISKDKFSTLPSNNKQSLYMNIIDNIITPRQHIYQQFHHIVRNEFGIPLLADVDVYTNHNGPYIFSIVDRRNRLLGLQEVDKGAQLPTYSEVIFRAIAGSVQFQKLKEKMNIAMERLLNQ